MLATQRTALLLSCIACATIPFVAAQRTDEASEARITDPTQECTPYNYPATAGLTSQFPTIWQTATIPATDADARALFTTLNATIPNIAPRGTRDGNLAGVTYPSDDPACWWTRSKCTTPKAKGVAADVVRCPEPSTWGLTFDDGPNCSHNAFYDYLRDQNQKATLFYIGSNVLNWPLEAQRGLADGHEICAHTFSHPYMTALTNEQAFAELYYSKKAIKDVTGVTVQCWRAPFGDVDDRIRYIAQALGMQSILWDNDTDDFSIVTTGKAGVDANYNRIIQQNGGKGQGIIVLSHELNNGTMSEFQQFYPQIKSAFKQVVPVGSCLNNTKPYLEQNYVYPAFADYTGGSRASNLPSPTAGAFSLSIPLSSAASPSSVTPTLAYTSAQSSSQSPSSSGRTGNAVKINVSNGQLVALLSCLVGVGIGMIFGGW